MINVTVRLYESDSYCREFNATVQSCECIDGFYNVVLNQTAFFPEGGGQAADSGTLNGVNVVDVQIKDDIIIHKTESPLPIGEEVQGRIDWDLRFSRMQSHAGEHIVSGVVHSLFGYSNVGFHMSETVMTVDFSGPLSQEDIEKVELESNLAVYANVPIFATYPTKEELAEIDYRSKIEPRDGIRLINIQGVDCCACCAPHPSRTGEIGLIKIIDSCPRKKGTRIEMVAGINAFKDYAQLHSANKSVMGMLSAARDNVKEAVSKQKDLIQTLRNENQTMSKKLAFYELEPTVKNDCAYAITENQTYDDLIYCANSLIESGIKKCILLSQTDSENYIYVISSVKNDVKPMVSYLNTAFNGKGGGRDTHAQGKIVAPSQDSIKPVVEEILND